MKKLTLLIASLLTLSACVGVPKGIKPVSDFELSRYLGSWYEIARLDHSFERGMENITAEYSLREDGGVKVKNTGYLIDDKQWDDAIGKAFFVEDPNTGHLKVSFFGPFYASYVIFELDPDYRFAFVAGNTREYLWLLSRTPQVDDALKKRFIDKANQLGFDPSQLIWVDHQTRNAASR